MAHYVIGTAGHIDHGKTSLVKALTGIDTDRLPEEKERGITIELGFAHLALPRHGAVGVVDVPGHERFVRTMVAGAVGIDLVVLVVAADEGVMPQTREHLDICGLLGIRRGLVALTKADLVDGDLLMLALADVREALRGTFLEGAPVVPCSVRSGQGLPELVQAIDRLLDEVPGRDPGGLPRLPVDRVFSMKGFGTVATGTLWSGCLRVGDELCALPGSGAEAKVRGLQVHGQAVPEAVAGQRTAVNLGLSKETLARGQVLVRRGTLAAGHLLDIRLRYLPSAKGPLPRRSRLLFHAGTAGCLAQVVLLDRGELPPGESALCQVHLSQPMVLLPGDRFILLGFSKQRHHGTTVGGGEVLRVLSARHRRGSPALCQALLAVEQALSATPPDEVTLVRAEIARSGVLGRSAHDLLVRLPLSERRIEQALQRLRSQRTIHAFDRSHVSAGAMDLVKEAVLAAVAAHHAREPLLAGLQREALATQLPALGGERDGIGEGRPEHVPQRLLQQALLMLAQEGKLLAERELLRLPGHDPRKAQADQGLSSLGERLRVLYREAQLQPPRPEEAAERLKEPVAQVKTTLELLARSGALLRIKDLYFDREAVAGLKERLVQFLRAHHEITPAQFKDLVGQTRKFVIPLAEHFDAEKVTLRIGDVRRLRG